MDKTNLDLWTAFIGEAKANRIYTAYAMKAIEEGHPEIAQVFYEVAGAETAHAISHLKAMGEIRTTVENLRHVVESEQYESGQKYPRMIQDALKAGKHEAAESLQIALKREVYHLELLQNALKHLEEKTGSSSSDDHPLRTSSPPTPAQGFLAETAGEEKHAISTAEIGTEKARIITLERIREVVFGSQDGLISTVALVSSVAIATQQRTIVIVAGLAGALAGMISMATGSYLSSKAEKELHTAEIEREKLELEQRPEEETAELIEIYRREGFPQEEAEKLAWRIAQDKPLWLKTLIEKELGLSPELSQNPFKDALTMGISFILGAAVPILPYFFIPPIPAIPVSIGITILTLFGVGVLKAKVTRRNPWQSGLEILIIGSLSALLGYLIGTLVPQLLDISV